MILRWYLSITHNFIKVLPVTTLCIVVLTLSSMLSQLLAFLLPIKVVVLLGSSDIPNYFPEFLKIHGLQALVQGLSCMAFVFYIAHLVSEKLINWLVFYASGEMLKHSGKLILLRDQKEMVEQSCKMVSRSLASVIFVSIAIGLLVIIYTDLFWFWLLLVATLLVANALVNFFFCDSYENERFSIHHIGVLMTVFFCQYLHSSL